MKLNSTEICVYVGKPPGATTGGDEVVPWDRLGTATHPLQELKK